MMGVLAGGDGRRIQQRAARRNGWTRARRTGFIEELTATCNVKAACRKVGMHWGSVYNLRRRDPAFAALWDDALATGYVRLEAELMARALGSERDPGTPAETAAPAGDTPPAPFDSTLAARLLAHRHAGGRGRRAGPADVPPASAQDTDAVLARKLAALRRRRDVAR